MFYKDYEIKSYHKKYKNQVIALEKILWGEDFKKNIAYFEWKYENNPYNEEVIGVIGLYKDKVVGFIGFTALKWLSGNKKRIFYALIGADMCSYKS